MRRCGVHAGGCGGPLSPPGSETGNPTSWQEGDADLTEKLKSTSHNDRARSTRENGKRGGLSGFWELHVHKPRSPGRLSPHPAGAGTAGLQPRSYGWVPRPNRSPSGLGGLVRRSPLSTATPTPPRRPRLYPPSPCTSHASQTRPGDRKEHGTQGGTGRGAENSRTEDGTERGSHGSGRRRGCGCSARRLRPHPGSAHLHRQTAEPAPRSRHFNQVTPGNRRWFFLPFFVK